jgi:hypothetical protein
MVKTMLNINISKLIGIIIGLSLILVCSAAAVADNTQDTGTLIYPEKIGTGIVRENIQKFTGLPDEIITYVGTKELPNGRVYEVTTASGRFNVNAKTGEIESALIKNGLSESSPNDVASLKKEAKAFALKNYRNFSSKKMVFVESRVLDHGDAGKEYRYIWNEMDGNVYTMSSVMISIFPDWNNSISYLGIDRPLLIDTIPKVMQDSAHKTTLHTFAMGSSAEIQSKLMVIPDKNGQKLVWVVETVETGKDNTDHGGMAIIDAVSGDVLSVNPIQ